MYGFQNVLMQHGRALEWATSAVLLGFAVALALPGNTLDASQSYSGFTQMGLDEAAMVLCLSIVAMMRMTGLWINGAWKRSPLLRMIGAILGAGFFLSLAAVFAVPYALGAAPAINTGVTSYLVLGLADLLAAHRAAADVGHSQRPQH